MTESKILTFSDYRKMVPKLDRVIRDMEDLNNLSNGEFDDDDDISKLKIQVKSIKELLGVK